MLNPILIRTQPYNLPDNAYMKPYRLENKAHDLSPDIKKKYMIFYLTTLFKRFRGRCKMIILYGTCERWRRFIIERAFPNTDSERMSHKSSIITEVLCYVACFYLLDEYLKFIGWVRNIGIPTNIHSITIRPSAMLRQQEQIIILLLKWYKTIRLMISKKLHSNEVPSLFATSVSFIALDSNIEKKIVSNILTCTLQTLVSLSPPEDNGSPDTIKIKMFCIA